MSMRPDQPRILYVSYDGALEPLGQSQILPYLRGLAVRGAAITFLSFEKRSDRKRSGRMRSLQTELREAGIQWVPLSYHKHPTLLATAYDVLAGAIRAWRLARRYDIQVVHARSYVAMLMAWGLKCVLRVRVIFDMRGFWADERVEGRLWSSNSALYLLAKHLERRFLRDADEVITLTDRARQTIEDWLDGACPRVTVIPTCVDLERFSASQGRRSPQEAPIFVYAGSVGTWYLLPEMLQFTKRALRRFAGSHLWLLTQQTEEANRVVRKAAFSSPVVQVTSVEPSAVPRWMEQAHAGLAFYKPGFSRQGTCPTKIGEYLAAGLPVVVNREVGDMEGLLSTARVGVVIAEFSLKEYDRALDELERLWADPALPVRCRAVAETTFALRIGIERYWAVYERVAVALTPTVGGGVRSLVRHAPVGQRTG